MTTEMKSKIRPIYSELQGYLSQAPKSNNIIYEEACWNQVNQTIAELKTVCGISFDKFLIEPHKDNKEQYVERDTFRLILGGLISRLHGEYFSDELAPFRGMPSTIKTQNEQQIKSVQMFLDIQSKIIDSSKQFDEGSKEKKFIDKLKGSLSTVSNVNDLIKLCLKLAEEFGVGLATVLKIFS